MAETVTIDGRFNGPARSAQGGYVSGVLAGMLGGRAEVTLRLPPPLDVAMDVERTGDGLRLFTGPVAGRDLVAAPWEPDAALAGDDGRVRPEFVWAALDCPGGWAFGGAAGALLLGRFLADVRDLPRPGDRLVVCGWSLGRDGRKLYAGSAVHTAAGVLLAAARATWITVS